MSAEKRALNSVCETTMRQEPPIEGALNVNNNLIRHDLFFRLTEQRDRRACNLTRIPLEYECSDFMLETCSASANLLSMFFYLFFSISDEAVSIYAIRSLGSVHDSNHNIFTSTKAKREKIALRKATN